MLAALLAMAALPRVYAANTHPIVMDALATTFFVDPVSGSDTNPGTQAAPFKTLGKALTVTRFGGTIQLAQGTYSRATNGEAFGSGLNVPSDVIITGAGSSLVASPGDRIALVFAGNAEVHHLNLSGFSIGFIAGRGAQLLNNVNLTSLGTSLQLFGTTQTTLTHESHVSMTSGQAIAFVSQQAQLRVEGSTFERTGCDPARPLFDIMDTSTMTIQSSRIVDTPGPVLQLRGSSRGQLWSTTINRSAVASCDGALESINGLESSSLRVDNGSKIFSDDNNQITGITWQSTGPLTLSHSEITNHPMGIDLLAAATLTIENSSINLSKKAGLNALARDSVITINNSRFVENGVGIRAAAFKMRGTLLSSNVTAVEISGGGANLGTPSDPGGNVIASNTSTGIGFQSASISATVLAHGNFWNPSVQGADDNGEYLPQVVAGPTSGKNFILTTSSQRLQL